MIFKMCLNLSDCTGSLRLVKEKKHTLKRQKACNSVYAYVFLEKSIWSRLCKIKIKPVIETEAQSYGQHTFSKENKN